jgi:periplasmic divalent cation tolerance protein
MEKRDTVALNAMTELLAVFTTVATQPQADLLATAAVERRLAACVHTESITSIYRWNGAVTRDAEIRLMFKTTRAAYPALQRLVLDLHPYDLPAVFAIPVAMATAEYADWVRDGVDAAAGSGGA